MVAAAILAAGRRTDMSFRVTQRSLNLELLANLQASQGEMARLQQKLSSGREISRPSDSPTGTVSALRFRADLRRSEQLIRNADDGLAWLGTADRALTDGLSALNRARDLVLAGMNGALGQEAREALAAEVDGLRLHLVAVANTTYLDRPIFAGTAAVPAAFDPAGTYQGDAGTVDRSVMPGVTVQVNLPGPSVFGGTDPVFAVLADISDHLRNDPSQLGSALVRLDGRLVDMRTSLAQVGARHNQVETMRATVESSIVDTRASLAKVESIDLPRTVMDLRLQDLSLQAAMSAAARVLQPTLVDFLR
jgi:flagellar hook-associated protein 3 FlgL